MTIELFLFYFFSFFLVLSAFMVVFVRNTLKAVLYLILVFFSAAGIWILLEAEFLAVILILLYVGAIVVLFLFVVMMLNIDESSAKAKFIKYLPIGIFVMLVIIAELILVLGPKQFGLDIVTEPFRHSENYSNITEVASYIYTIFVYPFELAAVLLLLAIISAIMLVHRGKPRSKKQVVSKQVQVSAKDRLRIIRDYKGGTK